MDYELWSLIINTTVAITAILGIRQSYKSYVRSNEHVKEQMKLQQQPNIKLTDNRSERIKRIIIKNIGTGPAIGILSLSKEIPVGENLLDNLDSSSKSDIGTLGVNEEQSFSYREKFDIGTALIQHVTMTKGKEHVHAHALVYRDLFLNYYIVEFEIRVVDGISVVHLGANQRLLTEKELKLLEYNLDIYKYIN